MASKRKDIKEIVTFPSSVKVSYHDGHMIVKGSQGEVRKVMTHPRVVITLDHEKAMFDAPKKTKRERKLLGTYRAHFLNMLKGAQHGHTYKLKICSGHFPMNVKVNPHEFTITNFLGEKVPRVLALPTGVKVTLAGDIVTVESPDKELAGRIAAAIERLTKIKDKDLRIFQDGIYIIDKDGKEIK